MAGIHDLAPPPRIGMRKSVKSRENLRYNCPVDPVSEAPASVEFGRFRILPHRREVLADGRPIELGGRAFDVLMALIEANGAVVGKDELISRVWPGRIIEEDNLRAQIRALRMALADRDLIRTVAGRGYQFTGEVRRSSGRGQAPIEHEVAAAITAVAPRLSIVVLPFINLSDDREQQYFTDGITEDLTTDLSRLAEMSVISRNTAFTYRNRPVDTKQIGRELGVRYVLEGSVQRSGNRVRVSAQLIDAETDTHLWADRLDSDSRDLFALQNEITRRIAVALNLQLVDADAARPTEQPDALDYIVRGRAVSYKPSSRDKYAESIDLFERALILNPHSVAAQSYAAIYLTGRVLDQMTDSAAADMERAETLAGQALATAPRSPLAHFATGNVLRAWSRYVEAIREYETVLALDRNWVSAYAHIGGCKLYTGSIEETIPLQEQAIRLSPRDPQIGIYFGRIGLAHLLQSRIKDAILWLEKARRANPRLPYVRCELASAYGLNGEIERASAELAETRKLSSDDRHSSIAKFVKVGETGLGYWGVPTVRALFEATYFVGLRKAGMPEE
jgi:TolB-like protein/Flp pilus assembly protein TadD